MLWLQYTIAATVAVTITLTIIKWKALSEQEQKPYQEKYQKKNEEYKAAMEEYKKLHGKDVPVDDDEEEQEEPASKRARLAKAGC